MRVVTLSVLLLVLAVVAAVAGHHMLTTGYIVAAASSVAIGAVACGGTSLVFIREAAAGSGFLPRVIATAIHATAAYMFLGALASRYFPASYKAASALAGSAIAICGALAVFPQRRKAAEPGATDNPVSGAQNLR